MTRAVPAALAVLVAVALMQSQGPIDVRIDVATGRRPISPQIYGVAFPDASTTLDLGVTVARWGGNATSLYNWQVNASNRGADWYFESLPDNTSGPGESADGFVAKSKANGAEPLITIPTSGWVARLGPGRNRLASFSIAKYGPQTDADSQWFPDAGNGVSKATKQPLVNNDPNDASTASDPAFQEGWIKHLMGRFGPAADGGIRYYILDNEPSLWHVNHRDVHPKGATMDEVRDAFLRYSSRVKATDAGALILGPEEWGWSGYFYSGYDQQWGAQHGYSSLPDRKAHNDSDYLPWFLGQVHQAELSSGQRLLDVFTVHYFPQGGEFGNDTSSEMQQRRNRSTRSLWDPNYTDESWIAAPVQLVRRLRRWVENQYPGTKIGITEYNWGAEGHINGATAQADILGIFGREGLDMATRWGVPDPATPTYKAFKMFRNYDSVGSEFGDVSVSAVSPNPDTLAVFAAERTSDHSLTIMAVNKVLSGSSTVGIRLTNFNAGRLAQVWQLTSSNRITHLADTAVSGSGVSMTLPAQSVTLIVIPPLATVAGNPMGISIESIAAAAGTSQTANVSAAFAAPLRAIVRDATSKPVPNASVTFLAPIGGPSARFDGAASAMAVTDTSGVATAPTLTANGQSGEYTVAARVVGVATPASFRLTNRSSNGGASGPGWQNVTPAGIDLNQSSFGNGNFGVQDVLVDPARPSDVYAFICFQGVWKSTDYGQTFKKVSRGGGPIDKGRPWGVAIDQNARRNPSTPPTFYVALGVPSGAEEGLWKSVDGAVTWTLVYGRGKALSLGFSDSQSYAVDVDPSDSNHVLSTFHNNGSFYGVVESMDGGASWRAHVAPEGFGVSQYVWFIDSTTWLVQAESLDGSNGTWRTATGGLVNGRPNPAAWARVSNVEHLHGGAQIYNAGGGVIYMGGVFNPNGIFRSTDKGATWAQVLANVQESSVVGTATNLYAAFGWVGSANMLRATKNGSFGSYTNQHAAMTWGPKRQAVTFDGTHYVIIGGNWLGGVWRYVEP